MINSSTGAGCLLRSNSLIYEDDVKPKLLNYLYTTFLFSDADVDCELHRSSCTDINLTDLTFPVNLVAWNRLVSRTGPLPRADGSDPAWYFFMGRT